MFNSKSFNPVSFSPISFNGLTVAVVQIAVGGWYDRDEEDRPIRRDDDLEVIGLLVAFLNSV